MKAPPEPPRPPAPLRRWLDTLVAHLPFDEALLRARPGQRHEHLDRQLAWTLAFVAGAINAGGFLAVGTYTSHVTGSFSRAADELVLGRTRPALGALAMVGFFLAGAFTTGLFVQLGTRLRLRGRYALALAFEAGLLCLFGLSGTTLARHEELMLPATVVLLCFLMGMHNAVVTHISSAVVRTTHMTGIVTDLGIELARWTVRHEPRTEPGERALRARLSLHALVLLAFFCGGLSGALGFARLGYSISLAFAAVLLALALRPIALDLRLRARLRARRGRRLRARGPSA